MLQRNVRPLRRAQDQLNANEAVLGLVAHAIHFGLQHAVLGPGETEHAQPCALARVHPPGCRSWIEEGHRAQPAGGNDGAQTGAFGQHGARAQVHHVSDAARDGRPNQVQFDLLVENAHLALGVGALALQARDVRLQARDQGLALAHLDRALVAQPSHLHARRFRLSILSLRLGPHAVAVQGCHQPLVVQRLDLSALRFLLLSHHIRSAQPGARLIHLRRTGAPLAAHGLLLRGQLRVQSFDLRAQGRQSTLLGRSFETEGFGIQLDQDLALLDLPVQHQGATQETGRYRRVHVIGGRRHFQARRATDLVQTHPRQEEPSRPRGQQNPTQNAHHDHTGRSVLGSCKAGEHEILDCRGL